MMMCLLLSCTAATYAVAPYNSTIPTNTSNALVVVIGDTQRTLPMETWRERNMPLQPRVISAAVEQNPALILLLGDVVNWGSDAAEWQYVDSLFLPIRKLNIPMTMILGNHEYYGSDEAALTHVSARFGDGMDEPRVIIIDSVAYILLNSNHSDITESRMRDQAQWFVRTLRRLDGADSIVCVVVGTHHPPYTNNPVVQHERFTRRSMLQAFNASAKAVLWMSGHAHGYERFVFGKKHFVVTAGGGGPRARLPEQRIFNDEYQTTEQRPLHCLTIRRDGNGLRCSMIPARGERAKGEQFLCSVATQ
jgi:hypothetical protein